MKYTLPMAGRMPGGVDELEIVFTRPEDRTEDLATQVLSLGFGSPFYLVEGQITWPDWQCMLEYDEKLLLYARGLSAKVHQFQQDRVGGEIKPALLAGLEQDLDQFAVQFSTSGRALPV